MPRGFPLYGIFFIIFLFAVMFDIPLLECPSLPCPSAGLLFTFTTQLLGVMGDRGQALPCAP